MSKDNVVEALRNILSLAHCSALSHEGDPESVYCTGCAWHCGAHAPDCPWLEAVAALAAHDAEKDPPVAADELDVLAQSVRDGNGISLSTLVERCRRVERRDFLTGLESLESLRAQHTKWLDDLKYYNDHHTSRSYEQWCTEKFPILLNVAEEVVRQTHKVKP